MTVHIARNDAVIVRQVTTATPTAANTALYDFLINGKTTDGYTSDASGTAAEIGAGLAAVLTTNTKAIPEVGEITWSGTTTTIATGRDDGQPFTIAEGGGSGNQASITTGTTAKSPNHWIAENFSGAALPANGDSVILTNLTTEQSFKWGLDQSAVVALVTLDIWADCEAEIGLPEWNDDAERYYQAGYRETHLKIETAALRIGLGEGTGSQRIKLNLGTGTATLVTVYQTSANPADTDAAPVHLSGSNAGNAIQVMSGRVDLAMLPGYTSQWPTVICSGDAIVRCGDGCTLGGTIEASGNSLVETRTTFATGRTRDGGRIRHIGATNISTALDIAGGNVEIWATGALTIALLNGYAGRSLDLRNSDSLVTITNATIYATPDNPFVINDPNNKLVMTNAASCPNGAESLIVKTGSGKTVKVV